MPEVILLNAALRRRGCPRIILTFAPTVDQTDGGCFRRRVYLIKSFPFSIDAVENRRVVNPPPAVRYKLRGVIQRDGAGVGEKRDSPACFRGVFEPHGGGR